MQPIEEEMKLDMFRYGETTIRLKCNSDGALMAERVPYEDQFKTTDEYDKPREKKRKKHA